MHRDLLRMTAPDGAARSHGTETTADGILPTAGRQVVVPWKRLALWFAASRVFIFAIAGISLRVVPPGPFFTAAASPLDWLKRWDAQWYLDVMQRGYWFDPTRVSNVNFLPFYPFLVRCVSWLFPRLDLAAYFVSNALAFAAAALI